MAYNNVQASLAAGFLTWNFNPGLTFGPFSLVQGTSASPSFPAANLAFGVGAGNVDLIGKPLSGTLTSGASTVIDLLSFADPAGTTITSAARMKVLVAFNNTYTDGADLILGGAVVPNPTAAPTGSAAGTGGTFAANSYLASYTFTNASGESLRSPDSSPIAVSGVQTITLTLPALPTGATGINVYLSTAGGATASETKQNGGTPIVATTYNMTSLAAGAAPPTVNMAFNAPWTAPFSNVLTTGNSLAGSQLVVKPGFATSPGVVLLWAGNAASYPVSGTSHNLQLQAAAGQTVNWALAFLGVDA